MTWISSTHRPYTHKDEYRCTLSANRMTKDECAHEERLIGDTRCTRNTWLTRAHRPPRCWSGTSFFKYYFFCFLFSRFTLLVVVPSTRGHWTAGRPHLSCTIIIIIPYWCRTRCAGTFFLRRLGHAHTHSCTYNATYNTERIDKCIFYPTRGGGRKGGENRYQNISLASFSKRKTHPVTLPRPRL